MVAVYSALKRHSALAGLVVLGDLSIQGNIKSMRSLAEPRCSASVRPLGTLNSPGPFMSGKLGAGREPIMTRELRS